MSALPTTLTSAIEKAVETHKEELASADQKLPQDLSAAKSEETVEEESAVEKEAEKEEKKEEVDLDAENGRILIKALRDPEQAGAVIDFLAKQAGYTKGTVETKQEVKAAKADITQILEASLGEEFKFLAPKLAPAIKEAVEALRDSGEDKNADLRERLDRQELREIEKETSETHVALAKEYFNSDDMPDNVVKAMSTTMDQFPPSDPKMSGATYYRKIFHLVAGELGLVKKQSTQDAKVAKSRSDASVRDLTEKTRGITPDPSGGGAKKMTLTEAVNLATKQVEQAMGKKE